MARAIATQLPALPLRPPSAPADNRALLKQLFALALPVLAENMLHMVVGINDTYLANHLPDRPAAAGAAIGTVTYFLWFIGLIAGSIGAGGTALIARAKGARHRSLANSVCGQTTSLAILVGVGAGLLLYLGAGPVIDLSGLLPPAHGMALSYLRMLSVTLPFTLVMFLANACLRGAGDTVTPALAMIVVDVVNVACSWALCRGWVGLPRMGFDGIAIGTIIAYVAGGLMQFVVLLRGRGGIRLHLHRMRPHWHTLRRLLKIGLPAGADGVLSWLANFGVMRVINSLDPTNAMPNAHMNAIRLESVSFMTGFAFATAAATLVGQSLGMKDVPRARRAAYLAYAVGGGAMTAFGILFIFFGWIPARWLSPHDPHIAALTAQCLFITGFIQSGFAAYAIFGGALRGAGDTFVVMLCSLVTVVGVRFLGVMIVGAYFHRGLGAIWVVLASELFLRGTLAYARFLQGGWTRLKV